MRHKLMSLTVYVTLLVGNQASGEELKEGFSNESELSVVTISGNSNSESYAGKSLARIKDDGNIYSLKGRYIDSRVSGQQSSKVWELTGRYERQLSE
ncbi:MAG: DUF481 domain-containing protein, partial [Bdellovibrionota bacterium]